jgi:hypothetical protein
MLNGGLHQLPISFGLQLARGIYGSRILVVDEANVMANKNVIFDRDAFADEGVA